MDGRAQHLVSLWHFCVVANGLDGYNGHLLGTMAMWYGGFGLVWIRFLTDGNHQWIQMAAMTTGILTALGCAMAVRCCRVSDRWESLIGCLQWFWVFCLTGLTSKGGMEGYEPG